MQETMEEPVVRQYFNTTTTRQPGQQPSSTSNLSGSFSRSNSMTSLQRSESTTNLNEPTIFLEESANSYSIVWKRKRGNVEKNEEAFCRTLIDFVETHRAIWRTEYAPVLAAENKNGASGTATSATTATSGGSGSSAIASPHSTPLLGRKILSPEDLRRRGLSPMKFDRTLSPHVPVNNAGSGLRNSASSLNAQSHTTATTANAAKFESPTSPYVFKNKPSEQSTPERASSEQLAIPSSTSSTSSSSAQLSTPLARSPSNSSLEPLGSTKPRAASTSAALSRSSSRSSTLSSSGRLSSLNATANNSTSPNNSAAPQNPQHPQNPQFVAPVNPVKAAPTSPKITSTPKKKQMRTKDT